jgi:hypothetical protein
MLSEPSRGTTPLEQPSHLQPAFLFCGKKTLVRPQRAVSRVNLRSQYRSSIPLRLYSTLEFQQPPLLDKGFPIERELRWRFTRDAQFGIQRSNGENRSVVSRHTSESCETLSLGYGVFPEMIRNSFCSWDEGMKFCSFEQRKELRHLIWQKGFTHHLVRQYSQNTSGW